MRSFQFLRASIPAAETLTAQANVSVFVMTSNEEINIRRCLDSVCWSDDVVVLDSLSLDRTTQLARAYPNVRIYQRRFRGFSDQRNFGLHSIVYRNRWVLVLDADEEVTPGLAEEVRDVARFDPPGIDLFLIRRNVVLDGRRLHWNLTAGVWIERLVRPSAVRYEGPVHEKLRFAGGHGRLSGRLDHHQFSKGIADWLARRASYAELEQRSGPATAKSPKLANLISRDSIARHAALKSVFHRLPARWLVYFLYSLLFRFPYLDGTTGLKYLYLESLSQFAADRKRRELRNARICATY